MKDRRLPVKSLMARIGERCGERVIYNLDGVFNYLHVGWWTRTNGFEPLHRCKTRYEIFDRIADDVGDKATLYLEFGVAQGVSFRYWTKLLTNPAARLHGFDSFLGLPRNWSLQYPRGYFSNEGAAPEMDDPRAEFVIGWFNETLPTYEWPEHEALVVMLDADLYDSTTTVLAFVKDKLVPGSYLYFDQFHHRCDELRAFEEFLEDAEMTFRLVAATSDLACVAFQRTA